jgi:NAD(P)-dependent dehydrogenase (short-subunit alcohol dehydrogenase family)
MKRLQGKVAVITGGNSGIGLASAQRLKEEGAKVAITGRSQKTLDEAVKLLGSDILFANAGVAKFLPVTAVTEAHYDEQFDINSKGAYFTIQKALPYLNDGASIILNTSVVSHQGLPTGSVYAATKAAMRSLTRSFASALVERNIRVNAVAPGPIETPIFGRTGLSKEEVEGFATYVLNKVPMKRFGKSEEVASAVAFLASSDASYITGVELNVDGGMGQI